MRRGIRIGWIVAGALVTVPTVVGIAFGVTTEIIWPHRSYESGAVVDYQLSETSKYAYTLFAPEVLVETTGKVTVSVVAGRAGLMAVERERLWYQGGDFSFSENWDHGQTLQLGSECPPQDQAGGPVCRLDYTLAVPPGTDVRVSTPEGSTSCSPQPAKAICGPRPSGG